MSNLKIGSIKELHLYILAIEDSLEHGEDGDAEPWVPVIRQWGRIQEVIQHLASKESDDTEEEAKIDAILEVLSVLNNSITELTDRIQDVEEQLRVASVQQYQQPIQPEPNQWPAPIMSNSEESSHISSPPPRSSPPAEDHLQRDADGNPFNKDIIFDPSKSTFA